VSNETPSIVAVRISNPDYRISVAAGADRGLLKPSANRTPFACSGSASSRIRFTADPTLGGEESDKSEIIAVSGVDAASDEVLVLA
jgi:hypothetical protein